MVISSTISPTRPTVNGVSREELPAQTLPSIKDLIGNSCPPPFQSASAVALSATQRLPTLPSSYASNQPAVKPSSSEQILHFEPSELEVFQNEIFANDRLEHQEGTSRHPMESAQEISISPFYAKSLPIMVHGRKMPGQNLALPDNPRFSEKSNPNLVNVDISLRAVRFLSGIVNDS